MDAPRAETVANGQRDIIGSTDVQNLIPVGVGKVFCVVQQTELGVDGAAARNDPRQTLRRQGDVAQQHAGVDREVVYAL